MDRAEVSHQVVFQCSEQAQWVFKKKVLLTKAFCTHCTTVYLQSNFYPIFLFTDDCFKFKTYEFLEVTLFRLGYKRGFSSGTKKIFMKISTHNLWTTITSIKKYFYLVFKCWINLHFLLHPYCTYTAYEHLIRLRVLNHKVETTRSSFILTNKHILFNLNVHK